MLAANEQRAARQAAALARFDRPLVSMRRQGRRPRRSRRALRRPARHPLRLHHPLCLRRYRHLRMDHHRRHSLRRTHRSARLRLLHIPRRPRDRKGLLLEARRPEWRTYGVAAKWYV